MVRGCRKVGCSDFCGWRGGNGGCEEEGWLKEAIVNN